MQPLRALQALLRRQPALGIAAAGLAAALLLWARLAVQDPPPRPAPAAPCNRACLEQELEAVMAALVAHDAASLPLAGDFRYIENNQHLAPGDGAWRTLQGFGSYRHFFADPEDGTAAVITTVRENEADAIATLRILVKAGRLAEVELVITHDPDGAAQYAHLGAPAAEWLEAVSEDERLPREELLELANKYYGALESNDGKGDYSFFADDCDRVEHGRPATHDVAHADWLVQDKSFVTMSCRAQFETGLFGFVTRIRDRRYDVIDVERGAVFASAMLDMNDKYPDIPLTDGKVFRLPAYFSVPRTLMVGEAFRIREGRIHDIEMTSREFPYGMPTGLRASFDPSREVPGGRKADAARPCDATCLESLAEQLLRAMAARDPQQAPLADTATYFENGQRLEFYDGLWGTISEIGAYRLRVTEAARHEISLLVRVRERELPGLLALHLRAKGDRIIAIEADIVREERPGAETRFRTKGPIDPDPARLTRAEPLFAETLPTSKRSDVEELVVLVERYFDAVEQGTGGGVRFTPDCLRRLNGVPVTNNPDAGFASFALGCSAQIEGGYSAYISRVRDRRILTIDESRGLVVASATYDIPGTVKAVGARLGAPIPLPTRLGLPQTHATLLVFRIEDGAIRRIEGLQQILPYGTPTTARD